MGHYFINDDNLKSEIKEFRVNLVGYEFKFKTDNGVFSKGELDFGTRLLLETILKEGVLTPDYFSTHHNENTHTSLNHQLAIINYLLRSFIQTDKTEYKDLALKYLSTIEKIGTDWIKENKDLYYQINAKGEFKGIDYTTLTLEDLLVTQGLLEEIGNKKSKVLDKLINSKYQYLKDINHNISSYLKNELKEGGYIE